MSVIFDFKSQCYVISESSKGFEFAPSAEPIRGSACVMHLSGHIHSIAALKDGRKISQRLMIKKIEQLTSYAKQLAAHLGQNNEHKLMQLLHKKIGYLGFLEKDSYSLEDLKKLGRRLTQGRAKDIPQDPLLCELKKIFFREIDGIAATSPADKRAAIALIPYTRVLGNQCVKVKIENGGKDVILIRSDAARIIRQIRERLPNDKRVFSEQDLLFLAKKLTELPLGHLSGHPYLKAKKALLVAEMQKVVFTDEPRELLDIVRELQDEFIIVPQEEKDKPKTYKLEMASKHLLKAMGTFTEDKYDFSLEDIQTLYGLFMHLTPEVCASDAFAQEMRDLLYQEIERQILFCSPSKDQLQDIYKMVRALKVRNPAFNKLDFLVDNAKYHPKSLDLEFSKEFAEEVEGRCELYSNNASQFMSTYFSRAIKTKAQAETALQRAANGKWVLWKDETTSQGFVTVKTESGFTHHCLWGANASQPKSGNWAIYNACGALASKQQIAIADYIQCC